MSTIIKFCPFCGGIPKFDIDYGSFGYTPNVIHLRCNNCNVDMKKVDDFKDINEIQAELVERWNKRV